MKFDAIFNIKNLYNIIMKFTKKNREAQLTQN